jgi:hypothetical protein
MVLKMIFSEVVSKLRPKITIILEALSKKKFPMKMILAESQRSTPKNSIFRDRLSESAL